MNGVNWNYYDKFEGLIDKYMPSQGEGETMASQIVTAVNKLVYKWYNDGDVFDNTFHLDGWANDLSSYANWLYNNTTREVKDILNSIDTAYNDDDYEQLLKALADVCLGEDFLSGYQQPKCGSIYDCEGKFTFRDYNDYDDDYDDEDYDNDEYDNDEYEI